MRSAAGRRSRSIAFAAVLVSGFLFTAYLAAIALSEDLLTELGAPEQADALVVLGGDGPPRAAKAARLWLAGSAPAIRVAGQGDCNAIRDTIIAAGVPASAISVECLSRNTWENALNTVPFADKAGLRSGILVTSWFHSKRALETFRALCPGVSWSSVPTAAPNLLATAFGQYGRYVAMEYVKLAAYRLRIALFADRRTHRGACAGTPSDADPPYGGHAIG
jgi:Uncharacterized conserved protein